MLAERMNELLRIMFVCLLKYTPRNRSQTSETLMGPRRGATPYKALGAGSDPARGEVRPFNPICPFGICEFPGTPQLWSTAPPGSDRPHPTWFSSSPVC